MNAASEDVKDMLLAESGLGLQFGINLFVGREPSNPDNCVTIFDTPGLPPLATLGNDSAYQYPALQILVRNRNYLVGYAIITNIIELLHNRGPETWNGAMYCSILCSGEPALLDWDANGRARLFTNFNLQRR
jgi:hypothetical protein